MKSHWNERIDLAIRLVDQTPVIFVNLIACLNALLNQTNCASMCRVQAGLTGTTVDLKPNCVLQSEIKYSEKNFPVKYPVKQNDVAYFWKT